MKALCAAAIAIAALIAGCDKPDWLAELEHKLDVAVPQLVAALELLAADLPAAAARVDAVLGRRARHCVKKAHGRSRARAA